MDRKKINDGIYLNNIKTDKFSSSLLSISFINPINSINPSYMSILPYILLRGSKNFDNLEKINQKLASLYGAKIEPLIRRKGEHLFVTFVVIFINSEFAKNENLLTEVYNMLCEIIWNPLVLDNKFDQSIVESEKINLINRINARKNDKRSYANSRMIEIMCQSEPYSTFKFGSIEQAESINSDNLFCAYNDLINNSQIEISYCGNENIKELDFTKIPKREVKSHQIKTKFDQPNVKEVIETMDITQGKLSLGFRTNVTSTDQNSAALSVFNTILGSSTNSKLFVNVRENMSLCYYASSAVDKLKGIMAINSGIEIKDFEVAKNAILKEFNDMCEGNFSDEDINSAKLTLSNSLDTFKDDQFKLEDFYLNSVISGNKNDIDDTKSAINKVSKGEIVDVTKNIFLDTIYFLKGDKTND